MPINRTFYMYKNTKNTLINILGSNEYISIINCTFEVKCLQLNESVKVLKKSFTELTDFLESI